MALSTFSLHLHVCVWPFLQNKAGCSGETESFLVLGFTSSSLRPQVLAAALSASRSRRPASADSPVGRRTDFKHFTERRSVKLFSPTSKNTSRHLFDASVFGFDSVFDTCSVDEEVEGEVVEGVFALLIIHLNAQTPT